MLTTSTVLNYSVATVAVYLLYKLFKAVLNDISHKLERLERTLQQLERTLDNHNRLIEELLKLINR